MTKIWFITGASSGLGRIMTEKLLDRGDRVIGTARRTVGCRTLRALMRISCTWSRWT